MMLESKEIMDLIKILIGLSDIQIGAGATLMGR